MDRSAFQQFAALDQHHWWFIGRRQLYVALLRKALSSEDMEEDPSTRQILDVGCGVGGFLKPLAQFGSVAGLEVDEPCARECQSRGYRTALAGESESLPIRTTSQDLITLFDVLEHTQDDRAMLCDAFRCLKPGGLLAVSVPAYPWLYATNDRIAHHYRRYNRKDLEVKLKESGFEVSRTTYVNVVLAPVIVPIVMLVKLKEQIFPSRNTTRTNLSWPVPPFLNRLLAKIFAGERHLLGHRNAPWGHSVFAIARKRA